MILENRVENETKGGGVRLTLTGKRQYYGHDAQHHNKS